MHWLDRLFSRLKLSIRAKLALTFIGTFVLLGGLLAVVLPSVIDLSMRSLVEASRDHPTNQALEQIVEDLDVCDHLLQREAQEIARGVELSFDDGRAGDWVRQPDPGRAKLQPWLANTQVRLGLDLLTVVDRRSVTVARATNAAEHGDPFCPHAKPLGQNATVVDICLRNALAGKVDLGFFVFDAEVLRQERLVRDAQGRPPSDERETLAERAFVPPRGRRRTGPEKRGLVLATMQPVRDGEGQIVGAVVGGRLLNNDPAFLDRPPTVLPKTGVSLFLGALCVASQPPPGGWGSWVGRSPAGRMIHLDPQGQRATVVHQLDGERFLSCFLRLRDPSGDPVGALWVTRRNELALHFRGLEALRQRARRDSLLLMAGEIVLLGILGLLLASLAAARIVGPLRRLRSGALALGAGNLDHRLEIRTGDELEDLAATFNDMADQLQDARRQDRLAMVGRMAGTIIHDLRNPLTAIRGSVPLLADKTLPDEQRAEFAEYTLDATQRIGDMIADLLDYSRGEERELDLQTEPLGEFLNHMESTLRREVGAPAMGLSLVVTRSPLVSIDHRTMERVILNLASNARDAMDGSGTLTLEAAEEGDYALLRIGDTGPGIPEEIRARVFEPFATFGKEHGTGLGLAICKQFVEAHGGSIEVDSTPGEGTTFTIRLPKAGGSMVGAM